MSDLYSYECKPYESSSDEDENPKSLFLDAWKTNSKKKPKVRKYKTGAKRRAIEVPGDSSDSSADVKISMVDSDDDDTNVSIGVMAESKASDIMRNTVDSIILVGSSSHTEATAAELKTAQDVLERFRKRRQMLEEVNVSAVEDVEIAGPSLTDSILASLPVVRRASERMIASHESLDMLRKHGGQAAEPEKVADNVERVRLRTVLNGTHEWKWKISKTDKFHKMKEKFAEIYGLPSPTDVCLKFDGDPLGDHQTPEDADLDDDDQIDAKIDKQLLESSIVAADKYRARLQSAPSRSTSEGSTSLNGTAKVEVPVSMAIASSSSLAPAEPISTASSSSSRSSLQHLHVMVLIPLELSANGEDTAAKIRVEASTTLAHLHRRMSNYMNAKAVVGDVWYSLQLEGLNGEGDISTPVNELPMENKLGDIIFDFFSTLTEPSSNEVTLMMHPPRNILEVFVKCVASSTPERDGEIIVAKAKPGHLLMKLMNKACKHFCVAPAKARFSVDGRTLSPDESFQEAGIRHGSEVLLSV